MGKIQVVKLNQELCTKSNVDDNEVLFIRVSDLVEDKNAMLEVPPTHNAILVKGGGDIRYYKSGNYDIFDDKKEIKRWKKGLSVEVIYIPKDTRVVVLWGTPNRITYRDESSNRVITVGARGQFDVSVSNPEQFYRKVVGAKKEFNLDEFRTRFSETIASNFADLFLKVVAEKKLTYDRFFANKSQIAAEMEKELSPMFDREWGLLLDHFLIADFSLLDEDMNALEEAALDKVLEEKREKEEEKKRQLLKEHLAELERLDDKQFEREKYLRQLELEDKQAYYEVLKVVGSRQEEKKEVKCPKCGHSVPEGTRFCPNCGEKLIKEPITCPKCGKVNAPDSKFCAECGEKLI